MKNTSTAAARNSVSSVQPGGSVIGSSTRPMNNTARIGTPRQNSTNVVHSARMNGSCARRPSAKSVPSGIAAATAMKHSTTFNSSPPQSAVGTATSPGTPPASSTPATIGTPTVNASSAQPRPRGRNVQSSAAMSTTPARSTRHRSAGGYGP